MSKDTFTYYREITARFDSTAECGHAVKKGDVIGWNRSRSRVQCSACWSKWKAENAAANFDERQYASQYGH